MGYKEGQIVRAEIPFRWNKPSKVHILHVLPALYGYQKCLIVYKVYGSHKQWWHTFLCTGWDMDLYIERAK